MRWFMLLAFASMLPLQGCGHWHVRGDIDDRYDRYDHDRRYGREGRWEQGWEYRDGDWVIIYSDDRPDFVPPGHMPPPGHARVWKKGGPPGNQPPPYKVK